MDITNFLGYAATTLSSVMLIPQLINTWKAKSTKDFSIFMLILGSLASLLWLVYGLLLKAFPVIAANSIVMSSWFLILIFKLKYR